MFNAIRALSFQAIETNTQPDIPNIESPRSHICKPSSPLMDIAARIKIEATHFTYQSMVYLGVADLNILVLFLSSFGSNCCVII